ncbi:MAG: hypothetical protein ACYTCU_10380 [Planctomycetota bacterium]|jgi:hypothetical protein
MTGIEPLRISPEDLVGDEQGPGFVMTAETAAEVAALADFPALAHLLGPQHFATLAHQAAERSARDGVEPDDVVHSLLGRRTAPLPDDVPARMAADVAAVERQIVHVRRNLSRCVGLPRVPIGALAGFERDTMRASQLEPIRALGIVPTGYRADGYVRRVHAGKLPDPPKRGTQTVVVYALGALDPVTWWRAVSPAEGRLLDLIALGETLGTAIDRTVGPKGFADEAAVMAALDVWTREGLFTRLIAVDPFGV